MAGGSRSTRTANFCAPNTDTCATPLTIEMRCAIVVSAYSSTVESGSVSELTVRKNTGVSAGFTFRKEGGDGMPGGSWRVVRAMAVCTSCAAASMFRSRSNCSVTFVLPWPLVEVICEMPGIVENCFSSGVATDDAIVSGLAPGRLAET